jgi:hypothetical protein
MRLAVPFAATCLIVSTLTPGSEASAAEKIESSFAGDCITIDGMTEAEREMMETVARQEMGGGGGGPPGGGMGGPGGGMGGPGGGPMGGGPGGGGMARPGGDRGGPMNPEIEWLSVTLKPRG